MLQKLLILLFVLTATVKAQTFTGTGGAIPDAGAQTCFPITVTGVGNINGNYGLASVCLNITHTWDSDLEIILKAPDGTIVQLSVQNGGSGDNYTNTCFSASAVNPINAGAAPFTGSYLPQGYLGNVNNGQNANGIWQLCIQDITTNDFGSLQNWSLNFNNTPAPPPPVCTSTQVASNTCQNAPLVCNFSGFCGATSASYTADTWPQLTAAFCSVIENNAFIKFIATSTTTSFNVWVTNSLNGLGIQLMVYSGGCGSGAVTTHACNSQIFPTSVGPTLITANGLTVGNTYYIMIDGYNGDVCDYIIVATNGTSALSAAPINPQICPGDNVTLTATGGNGNYTWAPTTGLNTTTGAVVIANPTATITYTLSSSATGNCPLNTNVTVNVNPKPTIGADKNISICVGSYFNLTTLYNTTGLTTSWTKGSIAVADPTNINTAGVYRIIAKNNSNCCDTAFVTISLVAKPNLGADKIVSNCPGKIINLNALYNTTGFIKEWTYNGQPFLNADSAWQAGMYQLIAYSGNACADTAIVTLNIYPKPNLGNDLTIKICNGIAVDATTIFNTTGLTTLWTLNGLPVTNPTAIITVGNYQLIATNNNGCADTALFTIANSPQVNLGNDTAIQICSANPINLNTIYNTTGFTSNWSVSGTALANVNSINTTGIYRLIAVNGFTCKDTAFINLVVRPTPYVGIDKRDTICQGAIIDLNSYFNNSGLNNFWTNANNIPINTPLIVIDSNVYRLIAKTAFGCTDTAFLKIDAKPSPNLGPDKIVANCPNISINLTQQFNTINTTSNWTFGGIPVANPTTITVAGTYKLIVLNNYNCYDTAYFTYNIISKPNLGPDKLLDICNGQTVNLSTQFSTNGLFTYWTIGGSAVANTTTVSTPGIYQIIATNGLSCIDTALLNIQVNPTANLGPDKLVRVCAGQPIDLNNYYITTGLNTSWTLNGIPVATPNYILTPGIYQLIASNNFGCADTAVLTLVILTSPILGPDKSLTVCPGISVDISNQFNLNNLTGSWTYGGFSVLDSTNVTNGGLYRLIAKNSIGCTDTAFLNVIINPNLYLGADINKILCDKSTLDLTTIYFTSGLNTSWSLGGVAVTSPSTISIGGLYRVIANNGGVCQDTAYVNVFLKPKPTIGNDTATSLCQYNTVNLTSFYNTTGLYTKWTIGNIIVPTPAAINTQGIYQLIASNVFDCADTALVNVIVNTKPVLGNDTSAVICATSAINLNNYFTTIGLNLVWTLGNTAVNNAFNTTDTGTFKLIATSPAGCKDSAFVTISNKPKPNVGPDKILNLCNGQILNLQTTAFDTTFATINIWTKNNVQISQPDSVITAGNYQLIASLPNGCTDTAFVNATFNIKPNLGADKTAYLCPGSSIGLTAQYNTVGLSTVWLYGSLPVPNPSSVTATGIYQLIATNNFGCTDTAEINVIVSIKPSLGSDKKAFVCPGTIINLTSQFITTGLTSKWIFNSNLVADPTAVTASGIYQLIGTNTTGCSDTATFSIIYLAKPFIGNDVFDTICAGNFKNLATNFDTTGLLANWTLNGFSVPQPDSITVSSTYQIIVTNSVGCTDTATTSLFVLPKTTSTTTLFTCSNQLPFNWNGNQYNAGGVYSVTLINAAGCDSIASLKLLIKDTSFSIKKDTICSNQLPYSWNGNTYNTAGIYKLKFTNTIGCDSIAILSLIVKNTSVSNTNKTICPNQLPFSWNGIVCSNGGTFNKTLVNAAGCDSVATLQLFVLNNIITVDTIKICHANLPYSWNTNALNIAGNYIDTFLNIAGCDSIVTLTLIINTSTYSNDTIKICPSQLPFSWNGITCNNGGTFNKKLVNAAGCDSIATLVLIVKSNSASTDTIKICPSQLPFSWNGITCNNGGTFNKTLANAAGCDSMLTLVLIVKNNTVSTDTIKICPSQLPYSWNGITCNNGGTFNKILINAAGCDSIATLVLIVKNNSASTDTIKICPSQLPFSWNGITCNNGGTFNKILLNAAGCDSIATLVLIVKNNTVSTDTIKICPSQLPYSWNGITCNNGGTFNKILVNTAGCDSMLTLVLIVKNNSASTDTIKICPSQLPFSWNGITCNNSGTFNKTLVNAAGCDSMLTMVLIIKNNTASITNVSICSLDLPYSWNGNTYTAIGTYAVKLTNSVGCDSTATLVLNFKPPIKSFTPLSVCSNAIPFLWNGQLLNSSGSYQANLKTATGCDSIATCILTVNATINTTVVKTICSNKLPYIWNGSQYTATGIYTKTLSTFYQCDSIVTLHLTINPIPSKPNIGNDTLICYGDNVILNAGNYDAYLWQDNSISNTYTALTNGQYFVQVMDKNKCANADTITISLFQNCDDISFPSAFSPNADRLNDQFGALGNLFLVNNFTLTISNRFGEVVFFTNNPYLKWDGMYKGKPASIGAFIWQSSYLYNNKLKKSRKGTITLVR